MTDELIKQLVLRLKVEGQDEFSKIAQGLAKTSESAAKAVPTREITDLVRLSEKLGGEFKKVVDSLTNVRLTNLKSEIKSIDQEISKLQQSLKGTTDEMAKMQMVGQIGGLGATRESLTGMASSLGKQQGFFSKARPLIGAVAMAGAQGYQMYGQYQEMQGQIGQRQIDSRLQAMEQLFTGIQRQQTQYYGGDLTSQLMDRKYNQAARETARAQVQKEREQLEGRVKSATGGIFTGAMQQGAIGAASGAVIGGALSAPAAGVLSIPGAVIGGAAGAIRGGWQGYMERQKATNELEIYQRNERARREELTVQNLNKMGQTDQNRIYYKALEDRATPLTRYRRSFGGDTGQVLGMAAETQSMGEFSEQEAMGMAGQRAGRLGGFRSMSLVNQTAGLRKQGYGGDINTQMNLMQAISRQGGAAANAGGIFQQTQMMSNQQLQEGLMQSLGGDLGSSRMRMNPATIAKRQAFMLGQTTPGEDVQMKLDAFQKVMSAPDVMKQTGTIENQIVRSNMRDIVLRSGRKGGEAVAMENMLSTMSVDELQSPEMVNRMKKMGIDPREVMKRRRSAQIASFEAAGVPQDIISKLKKGKHLTKDEQERLAMVESGGNLAGSQELGVMGRRLESEATGRTGGKATGPLGKPAGMDEIFDNIATAKGSQKSQLISDAINKYGGDPAFRDRLQGFLKEPPAGPDEGGTGDLGDQIDNVRTSLDAFVKAVNGATSGIGGIPPGQANAKPGAANTKDETT